MSADLLLIIIESTELLSMGYCCIEETDGLMADWLLIVLFLCFAVVLFDLLIHLAYAAAAFKRFDDAPPFHVIPPPANGPVPEPFAISTGDGVALRGGVYYPSDGKPVGMILFCPETHAGFQTALNYAPALLNAGFAIVSFDFRNQGASDTLPGYRDRHWLTEYEVADVQAVLDFIQAQPQFEGLPIGIFGVSRGGSAALAAAAIRPDVQYVLAQGPFSTHQLALYYSLKWLGAIVGPWQRFVPKWHVRVTLWFILRMAESRYGCRFVRLERLLPRLADREVLIISGGRDSYVPEAVPRQICKLTGHSPQAAHWVVRSAKHNLERHASPSEFDAKVVGFFEQMLSPEGRRSRMAETVAG